MKKPGRVIIALAALVLFGGFLWLLLAPRGTPPSLAITIMAKPNPTSQSSGNVGFRVRNDEDRAILLTDLIIEVRTPSGWRAFSHTVPTHPQRLSPSDTKELVIGAPGNRQPWRLRVTYGKDMKGPVLLLAKAVYAIRERRLPGPGFGLMGGHYSCVSQELSKR